MEKEIHYPAYTVVIRTLGKAGEKYLTTLRSAKEQDLPPQKILVYIPYKLPLPKETIGVEEYVRCEKGMVTQRSLPFDEVQTDWILFLDDDMYLPPHLVRRFFDALKTMGGGDCIAPNIQANHNMSILKKIGYALMTGTCPHYDSRWAFRIRRSGAYSYNARPSEIMPTQTAAFACLLVRKSAYKKINYADERWLDKLGYALGDDQLFFYKLYRHGFKIFIDYDSGVKHLDAGSGGRKKNLARIAYINGAIRYLLWWRTQCSCAKSWVDRLSCRLSYFGLMCCNLLGMLVFAFLKFRFSIFVNYIRGINAGHRFAHSSEAKSLADF